MIALQKTTDAAGFAGMQKAANMAGKTFRDALNSTGMFEVQQVRLNSATDDYVKKLNQQKLSFRDIAKQRKIATAAYKEQLAMENMMLRQGVGSAKGGKHTYDQIVPKNASAELDTAGKRLAFMNAELKSGAHQMVNWGKNTQWAGRQLMVGFTMPIAAFGAAAGVMSYQVDKELTRIAKVYDTVAKDSMGIEKELGQLRTNSLETATVAAQEYGAAVQDTLNVTAELAATGLTGGQLQSASKEVMRIARLGEVDNKTAIDATVALQSVFRDTIKDSDDLADAFNYMNSIENATSLSTADFAEAIPVAASSVKAFGGDVKELGILLTAMKENGIGASEGANALKATMQRLGRPSKQVREEWQQLTGTDITKLVDDSDGLVEVFTAINNATKDLDDDARRKAFAGLFGSYQVSKMMALTKGMGELEQGVGQVSTAYDVANSSTENWAATAETEMERYQKSASGMWDIALNSLKIEMAEVGEPFLVVATKVVEGVSWIVKSFNELPQGVKVFAALAIGATALAGGLLMLTGLAANLAGNFIKTAASLTGLAVKMNIMDKDSRAAALATELTTNAELERQKALDMGVMHMNKYIAAQQEMTQAVMAHVYGPDVIPPGANYNPAHDPESPAFIPGASARTAEDVAAAERESTRLKQEQDKLDAKRAQRQRATAAFMAVEAAGMATMMFTSNETAQNWAQIAMMTGLIVPSVAALGPVLKGVGSKLKDIPTAMGDATRNAGKLNKNLSLAPRLLGAIMGPVGWITTGLAIGGLALYKHIKGTVDQEKKVLDAQKKITESTSNWGDHVGLARREMEKFNAAQYAGMTASDQNAFSEDQDYFNNTDTGKDEAKAFSDMGENSAMQQAAAMRMLVNVQRDYGVSLERAKSMVAALWMEANGTGVQTAINNVSRLAEELTAVGEDGTVNKVHNVYRALGEDLKNALDPEPFDHWWRVGGAAFEHAAASAEETGKDIGKSFADNFMSAEAGADAQENMDALIAMTMQGWDGVWNEVNANAREKLATLGIDTAAEFQKQWMDNPDVIKDLLGADADMDLSSIENAADGAVGLENAMIGSAAAAMGLAKDVDTIAELTNDIMVMTKTVSASEWTDGRGQENLELYRDMQQIRKDLGDEAADAFGEETGASMAMFEQNAMNAANGIKQGSSFMEAWWFWTNKTSAESKKVYHYADGTVVGAKKMKNELKGGVSVARQLSSILGGLSFGNLNAATILNGVRSSMEGIQGDIADAEEAALDDRQQAASDRQDARFSRESDALGARLDRESNALDAAWDGKREGLEKYWDARIDGIDKAIEAEEKAEEKRKSMFEAEIARINRLADMANTNIDFNVALNEGDLDEAARIQNNAQAKDEEFVFNREAERGSKKSENRVDRLEDKRDGLEDKKDAALEALDKREEAAKAYFDNYRKMEEASLQKSQDAEKASLEKRQELQKKNLDRILDQFLAFTPKNKKQLAQHMANLGMDMQAFGEQTLDPMGVTWSQYFASRFKEGLHTAGLEMKNDTMWKELGEKGKNDLIVALGFSGAQSWNHFMRTGEIKAFDEKASPSTNPNPDRPNAVEGYHTGGVVGSGGNSRKGVAKNYHGLHPSEVMVRALKGETVINKEGSERHSGILDDINAGRDPSIMGGAGASMGGLMSGMIAQMFMQGFAKNMTEKTNVAKQKAAQANSYGPWNGDMTGLVGNQTYALAGVKPWVAEAANYLGNKFGISNIGGVGPRADNPLSDHPMGLAADFMTDDVAKGNALAAEALKLMPALDATYMIWQKRIHSFDSRGWLPYSHPSGLSSPTLDHMDHVHISFRSDGKAGDLPKLAPTMGPSAPGTTGSTPGLVQGNGSGMHPLSGIGGKGGSIHGSPPAVDLGTVVGTPVHAVRSGVVTGSYDIPGYEPRADHGGLGYKSYGRVITLAHDGGGSSLYAHLSQRFAQKDQRVAGGTVLGLSGNTGYSLGAHLHFGATPSPYTYLRKGTEFVRYDNTPAMLHKGESVMTKQITSQLRDGAARFAAGDDNQYNVKVVIDGYNGDPDVLARKVAAIFERKNARMPSSRTVGNR